MLFKNKNVLVTGSSRNIGAEIVRAFADEGANVGINYVSSNQSAENLFQELSKKEDKSALLLKANITKEKEVINMIQTFEETFGSVDILINNAGLYKDSTVWKMKEKIWNQVIDVNLKGTFLCTKHSLPSMMQKKEGRIIMISSVVGQVGIFGTSNYSAAKAGLFGFTKAVAKEVVKYNITVNCLTLGYFDIGMLRRLSKDIQEKILIEIPMKRFGTINEIIEPLFFLSSSGASYITGQNIHNNGGYYM